jgi:hypothetical protein
MGLVLFHKIVGKLFQRQMVPEPCDLPKLVYQFGGLIKLVLDEVVFKG